MPRPKLCPLTKDYCQEQACAWWVNKSCAVAVLAGRKESDPAADVVEVVRCRECKYTEIWGGRLECHMHHDRIVHAEEYCAWGKRKDGGQDDV
jgi:hypothetical protein